jgi:hypothetical protein
MYILQQNGATPEEIEMWQDVKTSLARAPAVRLALYVQKGGGGKRKHHSIGAQDADFSNDEALVKIC